MKASLTCIVSALLALSSIAPVAAENKRAVNAFKRVDRLSKARAVPKQPALPKLAKRDSPFLNNATQKFVVNGTALPDVDFDVGESYAGLLPISSDPNESRQLYFWFFPSTNPDAGEEITVWFNGGPGCSSLSGLLTENGPFTWQAGTLAPVQNPYSWHNLTNMVWIEQPVGVGFTQGVPNITNEVELGEQFVGFWKNFVDAFGMQKYDMYITGESYGGYYVPYVADAFISQNDTEYYNLKGIAINDPIIGDGTNQQEVIVPQFVDYWSNLFYLNESFTESMHSIAESCNFTSYLDTYLTFPPPSGPFPVLPDPFSDSGDPTCDLWDTVYYAALEVNPCFNIYHITEMCPHPWSVMGIINEGDYDPPGNQVYFNRTDVQAVINAPVGTNWAQCTPLNVFADAPTRTTNDTNGDTSLGPAQNGVLQRVIEYTNNTIIGSGNLDFILPTNGTLLSIQNMTWNGVQGLQAYPGNEFIVPYHPEYNGGALAGAGALGLWGAERGLTFYQVQLSGHELPGYAAGAGYRSLELLLGRIKDLSETSPFTTQSGNFTGSSAPVHRQRPFSPGRPFKR